LTLRETRYSHVDDVVSYSSPLKYTNEYIKSAYITDIETAYNVTDYAKWAVGINNVFDKMPSATPLFVRSARNSPGYPGYTPYGLEGTYLFTRITANF
jgi:outer membrane receptor for ferrienterochelin and colicin